MEMHVLIEPLYKNSLWCRKYLEGLKYEAGKNSIPLVQIDSPPNSLPAEYKICTLLGSTPHWLRTMAVDLVNKGIRCIVVNPDYSGEAGMTSKIHIDYHKAMQMVASYFRDHQRNHSVLFGVNPSSSTDALKAQAFRIAFPEGIVCEYEGSVSESCAKLTQQHPSMDSVLCCNELAAIALLRQLQQEHQAIPDNIWLMTFGRSTIGHYIKPSITALEVDHLLVGRQIIKIAQILAKNHAFSTLCCTIDATIIPAETTGNKPFSFKSLDGRIKGQSFKDSMDFNKDPIIEELCNLDRLFASMLPSDLVLLQGVAKHKTYAEIAENIGMSENAIKYRMKRMMGMAEVDDRTSLFALFDRYLGKDWAKI